MERNEDNPLIHVVHSSVPWMPPFFSVNAQYHTTIFFALADVLKFYLP